MHNLTAESERHFLSNEIRTIWNVRGGRRRGEQTVRFTAVTLLKEKKRKDWVGRKGRGGKLKEALLPQPPAVLSLSLSLSLYHSPSLVIYSMRHICLSFSSPSSVCVSCWTKVGFQGRKRNENVWIVIGAPSLKLSIGVKHHTISLSVQ